MPGKKVFRPVILPTVHAPTAGGFRLSAWVATGFVSPLTHHDGRRLIEEHEMLRPDDGSWVESLAQAKDIMARDIESKAHGLLTQANAIRVEAELDRAREAEATETEAA